MGKITSTQSRNDRSELSDVGAQQQTVRQFFLKARFIPGPYFTYILRAHFSYRSALHSFTLITLFCFVIFWQKEINAKAAYKILVKSTTGLHFINILQAFFCTREF